MDKKTITIETFDRGYKVKLQTMHGVYEYAYVHLIEIHEFLDNELKEK